MEMGVTLNEYEIGKFHLIVTTVIRGNPASNLLDGTQATYVFTENFEDIGV
jgi:hypothetical protein